MQHFQNQMEGNNYQDSREFIKTTNFEEQIRNVEIKVAIDKVRKRKAAGEDCIPNEAWICGKQKILEEMHMILNKIWNGEMDVLDEWKTGILTTIFKKGGKDQGRNYRGIIFGHQL